MKFYVQIAKHISPGDIQYRFSDGREGSPKYIGEINIPAYKVLMNYINETCKGCRLASVYETEGIHPQIIAWLEEI